MSNFPFQSKIAERVQYPELLIDFSPVPFSHRVVLIYTLYFLHSSDILVRWTWIIAIKNPTQSRARAKVGWRQYSSIGRLFVYNARILTRYEFV